jgi:hypothetical protein
VHVHVGVSRQHDEVRVGVEDLGPGANGNCADQAGDEIADGLAVARQERYVDAASS